MDTRSWFTQHLLIASFYVTLPKLLKYNTCILHNHAKNIRFQHHFHIISTPNFITVTSYICTQAEKRSSDKNTLALLSAQESWVAIRQRRFTTTQDMRTTISSCSWCKSSQTEHRHSCWKSRSWKETIDSKLTIRRREIKLARTCSH
jgi:hypothetical protein